MSIYNTMQTAVSGLSAQASKLGTIGDNIANSSTTGYKAASAEFETLLGAASTTFYESGGVQTHIRYGISKGGEITGSSSVTDLAINGNGYFVVQTTGTATALTRAGAFVPDKFGNLVNTAGYKLMGYNLQDGSYSTATGLGTLQPVNISTQALIATPSSTGVLTVNVPSAATAVAAANLPSTNSSTATFTDKTSLTAYDNLGSPVNLDVYLTKTGNNTWEAAVYNKASAAAGGGFPYSTAALATQTLTFDATTGRLAVGSATGLSVPIPNGNTVAISLAASTQLATNYTLSAGNLDGNSPSKVSSITIGNDGSVSTVYENGTTNPTFRIPLANVESPDRMTVMSGNIYNPNADSGPMSVGTAQSGSLGAIDSHSLENSTVDLATELTNMISTQRAYEANSKVLTSGSDMLTTVIQSIHN